MKLTSIKWWCCVAWFNYQYFVCCNGNTCQPCQPNSDQLPSALPLTSSKYHHPEHSVNRTDNDIWIGFLAGYGNAKVILGALPLAVDDVNDDSTLLPGRTLRYIAYDIGKELTSSIAIKKMTEWREKYDVAAIIGPDEHCRSEALVADAWNLPMISYKCTDTVVSNKTIYHSFARTLAPASKVSKSVVSLLNEFNWNKFAIVADNRAWGLDVAHAVKTLAEQRNFTVTALKEFSDYIPTQISVMEDIVDKTYKTTRIYVFIGEHIAMIDFIKCLQDRNLLRTGEYMVISVDDEIYNPRKHYTILRRDYLDPYLSSKPTLQVDINSFRSVLKLSMTYPMEKFFSEDCERIKSYAANNFSVPIHKSVTVSVPISAAHLYDAVIIYSRAVTEVIKMGGDIRNGTAIMSEIFNKKFHSIQGFDDFIDSKGDAEGNYTVVALQDVSDDPGEPPQMKSVGYFYYSSKSSVIPEFKYNDADTQIQWVNSKPPAAEPECGFHGDGCKSDTWRYALIGCGVAFIILIVGAFLFKHYRYEQKLACLLWKVDMKEVTLISTETSDSCTRTKSLIQTCRPSLISEGTSKRAYTSIGLYRGNIVAVKRIQKRCVDLTRTIRKELKQMREVHHENIITFIGASVDNGSVAVLTSYCARGSLEDVLMNDDLYLDQMFISSLVSDILKGLIYLHDSDIVSHGNLRSSNCLVDSRWVCQLTDFGLHEFKFGQEEPNRDEMEFKRGLWKSPELLRLTNPPARGTQKGDVYSFGIVLFEIIGRNGPWGVTSLSNEKIVERVKSPSLVGGFFRPPIKNLNMPDYVRQCLKLCWEEEPDERPDIRLIRVKLKEMQSGLKPNIFDNMLAIMEKYAYNLEGLVQERTNLLYEEKKKTETLLLRMLPKTVAESLKRGEKVEAENFDCVTIFFSDLVGFTELCVQSTPFEVVEMLNDLYICCDSIISNYDVYKVRAGAQISSTYPTHCKSIVVETIGDAYMVVSGLPIRNDNDHVSEIASMALHILDKVAKLEIKHRPGELLKIRIGIHSGQCVAGVVGLKMPRYCLFGDTVNTASRMESSGEELKIHISETTHYLLTLVGGFKCKERGLTFIKGKGDMRTYWLLSEDDERIQRRFGSNSEMQQNSLPKNVAPDLISSNVNADSSPEQRDKPPAENQKFIRQRARSSYIGLLNDNLPKNAWMDPLTLTYQRQDFQRPCAVCNSHMRPLLSRKSMKLGSASINCNMLQSLKENVDNLDNLEGHEQSDCTCMFNFQTFWNSQHNRKVCYEVNRWPRSAPHITFMEV